jgi:hypothetical protein
MAALDTVKHLTPPYLINTIAFGTNPDATAVTANKFHGLFFFDRPVYILGMTFIRASGTADTNLTLTPGYGDGPGATATAIGAAYPDANQKLNNFVINDDGVSAPNDAPILIPANNVVGFTTSNNTVTNCKLATVAIKYRYQ